MTPPNAPPEPRSPTAVALVIAWFLAALAVFTWPVAASPASRIIGGEYSGPWRTLWAHAWTRMRLLRDGEWPLNAPEIAFPREGSFSSIAPVNDLLSLVPQHLLGLVPAFNLVVSFHLLLAAFGGYVLGRSLHMARGPALVCGTVFGFNAFLLSYGITSAVVETSTVGWLPWLMAAVVHLTERPRWGAAIAAGFFFAAAGLSSLYWAVLAAILVPIVAAPALWDRLRADPDARTRARSLAYVGLSIATAIALFWPPASILLDTYDAQGSVLQDYAERKQSILDAAIMADMAHDYATLGAWILPGKANLASREDMDLLMQTTYAGWFAMFLASFGLAKGRWRWLAMGGAAAVLSTGPYVFFTPTAFQIETAWWWTWLRELIPPARMITSYVRFSAFGFLGLAVLAGFGTGRLSAWAQARGMPKRLAHTVAGLVASSAVLLELAWVSPVPFPIPSAPAVVPPVSHALAAMPLEGAVLDWPQRYPGRKVEVSRYFFYQSAHWRPIAYDFAPTSYMPSPVESNAFFAVLERLTYGDDYDSGAWGPETWVPVRLGIAQMAEMGYRYIAVHHSFVEEERRVLLDQWLESLLPLEARFEDGDAIFRIEAQTEFSPETGF